MKAFNFSCIQFRSKAKELKLPPSLLLNFHNARTVLVFNARKILPKMNKDVLLMLVTSNVFYKFACCC